MAIRDETTVRVVLYEGEGASALEANDRFAAMSALLERGYAVTRSTQGGRVAPQTNGAMVVLGRFANTPQAEDGAGAVNVRSRHWWSRNARHWAAASRARGSHGSR
jgi:hypothetical protein